MFRYFMLGHILNKLNHSQIGELSYTLFETKLKTLI